MSVSSLFVQLPHLAATMGVAWFVLASYRYIRRRSSVLGAVVALAILTRAALGLGLFWTSYLGLPVAQSLQAGGGFWQFAPDGGGYYQMAESAARAWTLFPLDNSVPSPIYVNVLACWMMVCGISPAAGMLLNLFLYTALVLAIVRTSKPVNDWRADLPCLVTVAAYSFAPAILLHSTQPLKDELSLAVVAAACFGVLKLRGLMHWPPASLNWAGGGAMIAVATFSAAGIRWYFACIICGALAVTLGAFAVRGRTTALPRYLGGSATVLLAAWLAFWGGAGPLYYLIAPSLWSIADVPSELMNFTQMARIGFLSTPGNTSIRVPLTDDLAAGAARQAELRQEQIDNPAYRERARLAREEARLAAERARLAAVRQGPGRVAPVIPQTAPTDQPRATGPDPLVLSIPITTNEQGLTMAMGLAFLFVPFTLIHSLTDITFSGGRGLLSLMDMDTLYLNATILTALLILWQRRRMIGDRLPFVVFTLVLAGTTALLLGYVVTNFGTLWRLRPLFAVPLWLLTLAVSSRQDTSGAFTPADTGREP